VIAGGAVEHLVVEEEHGARDETARALTRRRSRAEASSRAEDTKSTGPSPFVEAAAELEFFFGAPRLQLPSEIASAMKPPQRFPVRLPGEMTSRRCSSVMISQGVHSRQKVPRRP